MNFFKHGGIQLLTKSNQGKKTTSNKNQSVKIGIIGLGNMGQVHCRVAHKLGTLAAVVDIDEKTAQQTGNRYEIPWFTDWHQLMEKKIEITGLIIAVPTKYHYPLAKELLLQSPPHLQALLIEKPVSESVSQAKELVQLAQNSPVQVTVGHSEVFNPVVPAMIDLVHRDAIGEIRSVIVQRRGAVIPERIPSLGDVLEDIAVHDFDIVTRLLQPHHVKVSCQAVTVKGGVINAAHVMMTTDHQQVASFLFSREYAGRLRKIELEGTKATMTVNLLDQWLQIHALNPLRGGASSVTFPIAAGQVIKYYGEPVMEEHLAFYNSIRTGKPTTVTLTDAINTLTLVDAARKAHSTNTPVTVKLR